jgi:hypothetical protein
MKQINEIRIWMSMLLFALGSVGAFGQAPTNHYALKPASQTQLKVIGYLTGKELDFLKILPPYPVFDSIEDKADVTMLRQWQQPDDSPRWKLANADVKMSYDRFAQGFGAEISPANTPLLIHLLDRVERDVQTVAFSEKLVAFTGGETHRSTLASVAKTTITYSGDAFDQGSSEGD